MKTTTADRSRRGNEALTSPVSVHFGRWTPELHHFCTVSAPLFTHFFGAPLIINHFHQKLHHQVLARSAGVPACDFQQHPAARGESYLKAGTTTGNHFCTVSGSFRPARRDAAGS